MFPIVCQYLLRDWSQEAFIKKHRIHKAILSYWVTKYKKSIQDSQPQTFIEIQINEPKTKNGFIHIQSLNGMNMETPIHKIVKIKLIPQDPESNLRPEQSQPSL